MQVIADTVDAPPHFPVDKTTRQRLEPWKPADRLASWLWALAVTVLAGLARIINVDHPKGIVFDETFYAKDAWALLQHGYEYDLKTGQSSVAAHPPFGKWCIAFGEWLFGYNSFGWRFSAVLAGTISVLVLIRIARRLFRSTLLGCLAGLLLTIEGLHFTASRIALLDIFLLLFVLIAFGCLLLDRDTRRTQLLRMLERQGEVTQGRRGLSDWPWWRFAAAASMGLALSVKWSAMWFVLVFIGLTILWEIQARRSAGAAHPIAETIGWEMGWLFAFLGIIVVTYMATWTGWFITDGGAFRNWAAENNGSVWYLPDALVNWWQYESYIYKFHVNLDATHPYQSTPLSWLWMENPVLYYTNYDPTCGAERCAASISGIGNPLMWWSFVPAVLVCVWQWITHRDWRAGAIVLVVLAGVLPWFLYPDRTMFFFYMVPVAPFFILAVTMALGMLLGNQESSPERRMLGGGGVIAYVVIVALSFAYFAPIMTGISLPYDAWEGRFWFDGWI